MNRNRNWISALVLALAVTAGACGDDEPEVTVDEPVVEPQGVDVVAITLGSAIGTDLRVTEATGTFAPSDTIYVAVETDGTGTGELTARWTYEDGQVVDESSRSIAPSGSAVNEFHISKPDGWPAGGYEVLILLDGLEADRAAFTVEAGG